MIEIVEFDLAKFNQEGQIAEYLTSPEYKKNKKRLTYKKCNYYLKKIYRTLLAKLIVSAAYRKDEDKIDQYINFIYKRLFGDRWHENQVWIDQPINWLGVELIGCIYDSCEEDYEFDSDSPWNYEELLDHALSLINKLCKDRSEIIAGL